MAEHFEGLKHLAHLNDAQKEAVTMTEGPLLVLAGAGAGKTRVIAYRILELVRKGVSPHNILAITFTNKAAGEMRERVIGLLKSTPEIGFRASDKPPFISTFHSLALTIIKENYRLLGLKRFPVVYDRADSTRAIKQALKELGEEGVDARGALGRISRLKGEGVGFELFAQDAQTPRDKAIAQIWQKYAAALARDGAYDFDDLLAVAVRLLLSNEQVRCVYRNRFLYIHIDEYQDTNRIQNELVSLLVGEERNVCAVGDIDQTIYTWRGAEIKHILSFEKKYRGAKVVVLEENYRSTKTILAAANHCISKNTSRVEKNMFTRNAEGEVLSLYQAFDENDEAGRAARKILELIQKGAAPRNIAILYRANFQSRALEEALLGARIPYQVLGTKFFERAEVKDTISFIRAALFGTEADIARIANTPPRGIGKQTLLAMLQKREGELGPSALAKVAIFHALLAKIREAALRLPPSKVVELVIKESGIEDDLRQDKLEGVERLQNLRELVALASRYDGALSGEGVHEFLEQAALASDQDELKEDANAVRLMTVHASKGLEFSYVFITGLEQGLFPYEREDEKPQDAEEERRLMYVAITRAQKKVFLSCASVRTVFGSQSFSEPSEFLADIPESLLELEEPERLGKTIYLE